MALSMTITVSDTGQVGVTGPLENQIVCYGLLEVARDAIQRHVESQQQIKPATPGDMLALKRVTQ